MSREGIGVRAACWALHRGATHCGLGWSCSLTKPNQTKHFKHSYIPLNLCNCKYIFIVCSISSLDHKHHEWKVSFCSFGSVSCDSPLLVGGEGSSFCTLAKTEVHTPSTVLSEYRSTPPPHTRELEFGHRLLAFAFL